MARKRGEYQRRMERKTKISTVCGLLLFVFTIIFSVFGIISSAYWIQHIDDGTFKEYTGPYSYELRKGISRRSRYNYKITLGNGDTFTISSRNARYSEGLDDNTVIHVQYLQVLFRDKYTYISVATPDGSSTIGSLEDSRKSNVSLIWGASIVIVICSLLSASLLVLLFEKQIKQFQRWRKKKRKKRKQIVASK